MLIIGFSEGGHLSWVPGPLLPTGIVGALAVRLGMDDAIQYYASAEVAARQKTGSVKARESGPITLR